MLLSCPFCTCNRLEIDRISTHGIIKRFIRCMTCGARGPEVMEQPDPVPRKDRFEVRSPFEYALARAQETWNQRG